MLEIVKQGAGELKDLAVSGHVRRSDDVSIALNEFSKSTSRGLLRPPDRCNLIPTEWKSDIAVLRHDSSERDGEIVAQCDVSLAIVLKAVEERIALFSVLAREHVEVLESRRHQRSETEALKCGLDLGEHFLARHHRPGKIVSKTFQDSRFDFGSGADGCFFGAWDAG